MEELYYLEPEGAAIADDPEFQRGDRNPDREYYEQHLEPTGIEADLEALENKISEVIGDYEEGAEDIDKALAETVHQTIAISRKDAADERIWHYLAIVRLPSFVWYRWPRDAGDRTHKSMREKFKGTHKDIYSNAFHRLWWIAELTHDGSDYTRTERALGTQRLANTVFDRGFHRSEGVVKACIDVLHDESNTVIEQTTLRLNHALSSIPMEGLSETEIKSQVETICEDVKS